MYYVHKWKWSILLDSYQNKVSRLVYCMLPFWCGMQNYVYFNVGKQHAFFQVDSNSNFQILSLLHQSLQYCSKREQKSKGTWQAESWQWWQKEDRGCNQETAKNKKHMASRKLTVVAKRRSWLQPGKGKKAKAHGEQKADSGDKKKIVAATRKQQESKGIWLKENWWWWIVWVFAKKGLWLQQEGTQKQRHMA